MVIFWNIAIFWHCHLPLIIILICLERNMFYGQVIEIKSIQKPATQTSTLSVDSPYRPFGAELAVDGNRDQQIYANSCMHTLRDTNPWWMVDLQKTYQIHHILFNNVVAYYNDRLHNVQLQLGETKDTMAVFGFKEGFIDTGSRFDIVPPSSARFVKLQIIDTSPTSLHLCEVEVYVYTSYRAIDNKSLGKPITQEPKASNITPVSGPEVAVDGIRNSCISLRLDDDPWWMVDLETVYFIHHILYYIKNECEHCALNRHNIKLPTGNTLILTTWFGLTGGLNGTVAKFNMDPKTRARFIKLHFKGSALFQTLQICEVEVHGYRDLREPENLSTGKSATQVSTYRDIVHDIEFKADFAVDGHLHFTVYTPPYCSQSGWVFDPWWMVDLRDVYSVISVFFYNRLDCCMDDLHNVQLSMGLTSNTTAVYGYIDGRVGKMGQFELEQPVKARFVKLQIKSTATYHLHLCEVHVYGYRPAWKVHFQRMNGYHGTGDVLETLRPVSKVKCSATCTHSIGCTAFNFDPEDGSCELLGTTDMVKSSASKSMYVIAYK